MKLEDKYWGKEYYKIMLVSLAPDKCNILKGADEEKRLAEILQDDYSISRYEKMIRLVVKEKVAQEDQDFCFHLFSLDFLKEAFENGQDKVTGSYLRSIQGKMQKVFVSIYPRKMTRQRKLEEFMIYVTSQG
ncbi:hypothetical protein D3Z36_04805 [Lachnospiraceae bacterium]|nr:hypothetical protein [Lachnospiraceae bacterium]